MMLCLLAATVLFQGQSPYHYSGPMTSLLAEGAKIAPVSQGIPFQVVITGNGSSVGPASFKLNQAGWKGSAGLELEGLRYADGVLTATAKVANNGEESLQGVRLDVLSASEQYTYKDKDGKDQVGTRSQSFAFGSPLFFGDLLNGESQADLAFKVSNLKFAPETKQITVSGVVSGLRYSGAFESPGGGSYSNMHFTSDGKLMGDEYGREIFLGPVGGAAKAIAEVPEQCTGVAVHPKTGDIYSTVVSSRDIFIFSPTGASKGKIGEANGIDNFVQKPRFDSSGKLYACGDGASIFVIDGGKVQKNIDSAAGGGLSISSYDVAANGTIYLTNNGDSVLQIEPGGASKKIAGKAGWKFGAVQSPLGIRVDRAGLVYVGEEEVENQDEFDRVSVFDPQGRIVRVFGRGGLKPNAEKEMLPGQVDSPREMAFGPDGTVYVSASGKILMYRPF